MHNFLYFYQHIPYHLNPVAFSIGSFQVDWYSIMYLVGFGVVYLLLRCRIKKEELKCHPRESGDPVSRLKVSTLDSRPLRQSYSEASFRGNDNNFLFDLLIWIFVGLLVGARLGYVLFYNLPYYAAHPLEIISPFSAGHFVGIFGMSYHGGIIGALAAFWIFTKKYKLSFWKMSDFIVPAIPAGYFFGRLGNFFNGELWGRVTTRPWGMFFPSDPFGFLRHPSQLYEAGLEGLILFLILWTIRNKPWTKNNLLSFYIIGYASARIICEFFRAPDPQIGYLFWGLTLGQILSFLMLVGGILLWYNIKKNHPSLPENKKFLRN